MTASRPVSGNGLRNQPARANGFSVLVDARALRVAGLGRYLREVLKGLLEDGRFNRLRLLGDEETIRSFLQEIGADRPVEIIAYPTAFYHPRTQTAWLRLRWRAAVLADVCFFPHYDVPLLGLPSRSVVTVQDLIHFKLPGVFPRYKRVPARVMLRRAVRGAAVVLVSSEATERDLLEHHPSAACKVRRIPLGVSPYFQARSGEEGPARVGTDAAPFLLCVGNRKPHKNLIAAVETLARLREEDPHLRLVVVGQEFPGWSDVVARAQALGVAEAVNVRPSVSDEELRALYRRAEVLLFVSLYEGFGLPILEAMGCGTPVVASNQASIPEVVGAAGVIVDPHDYGAMAEAIRSIRTDPVLRHRLVRLGRERSSFFRWEHTAVRTADVLYDVARGVAPHAAALAGLDAQYG
jgi:glycosyltransferase involved in cell wall biosynthesis